MSINRKREGNLTPVQPKVDSHPSLVAVPRAWLAILAILLIVPWLVAGVVYWTRARTPAVESPSSEAQPGGSARSVERSTGPWGRLTATPIIVSPPLEYIAADWGRADGPAPWVFPGATRQQVESLLSSSGLPGAEVAQLLAAARREPRVDGIVLIPDPAIVRRMPPATRGRIYVELGKSPLNFDQSNSFRFLGSSAHDWFGGSLISDSTRRVVEPLVYRQGSYLHFADTEVVRSLVTDAGELRRLAKSLLRQSTLLVRLHVDDPSQVDSLTEYWGRGGRRLDLRPLLESVVDAGPDARVDIVHLLPTFARNHLYRYPRLTTAAMNKPLLANCLWSALNFFRPEPDDRFLDVNVALASLKQDYYVVEGAFQLGDVVAFLDEEGDLFHVAVHVADGLLFSKNGTSPMAPWTIVRLEQLKEYYSLRNANPRLIYHRRNDM